MFVFVPLAKRKRQGLRLKLTIVARGMSIKIFAASIGVSRQAVYDYFSGKYRPHSDLHKQIAELLGVSEDFLFGNA